MDLVRRIEGCLERALDSVAGTEAPPTLIEAARHAVFPGGGRLRPQLCLSVALACGDGAPGLADAAAAAVELLHCASLVHDDLPCFDDAPLRRGQPSVHHAFGEPLAVLAGDQLIVLAFETLARGAEACPARLPKVLEAVARGVGMPWGIIAGQAWESEARIPVATYRRAKTGALFEAAAAAGALAAGANAAAWRVFGARVGEAYQIADDIQDLVGSAASLGKPVGRDAALGRPNTATQLGLHGSARLLEQLVREATLAMPECEDPGVVVEWLHCLCDKLTVRSPSYSAVAQDLESGAA
jgi:geranylgeranyl diphosphate synthase type II